MRRVARRFLAVSLIAIALPANGAANCEVGGYAIHTIATYKEPDAKRVFLRYSVTSTGDIQVVTADSEGTLRPAQVPFEIRHGSTSCRIESGFSIDTSESDDIDDRAAYQDPQPLPLGRCDWLVREVPSTGMLLLDTVSRTFRFADEIGVDENPPRTDRADQMLAFVDQDLRTRNLSLSDSGNPSEARITPEMIDGRRSEWTAIGRGDQQLLVHVEILRIRGLQSAFLGPDNEWSRGERERYRLETGKADFPVLYLLHPSRDEPAYFGDGSFCAPKNFQRYPSPRHGAEGAFDRFRITRAFDFNRDEIADVLEVNGEVTYWIDPLRTPEVIHQNGGC